MARQYWLVEIFKLDQLNKKKAGERDDLNSKRQKTGVLSSEQLDNSNLDDELQQFGIF